MKRLHEALNPDSATTLTGGGSNRRISLVRRQGVIYRTRSITNTRGVAHLVAPSLNVCKSIFFPVFVPELYKSKSRHDEKGWTQSSTATYPTSLQH